MKGTDVPAESAGDLAGFQAQRGSKRPRSQQNAADPARQRSSTAVSRDNSQPARSRGSTASIQSSTTTGYMPEPRQVPEGYEPFHHSQHAAATAQHQYNGNPEDMIIRFGDQLANSHSGSFLDPALQNSHNSASHHREVSFTGPGYHNQENLGQHGMPGEPQANHYQPMFETMENQVADPMVEENDGVSESGPRKRRGTTSSIANDKELRRLLRQYDGFNLQQMAAEVQKHEGAGGKSEKVKQVFAMIWLKENCRKCSGSVRRDRVYCCYAEKCGTERVSVLNPASFGKLVRIIFPNVQTRRLGVRGESKYHYVDLTIVDQGPKSETETREVDDSTGITSSHEKKSISEPSKNSALAQHTSNLVHHPHQPMPSLPPNHDASARNSPCEQPRPGHSKPRPLPGCEAGNMDIHRRLKRILYLPPDSNIPAVDTSSLQLPDVHEYLPANSDSDVADALTALYRSHCISVIDSFRFCREKSLFRHFSAFQGTLTVPVQKLLVHPDIAPWIEECDWLMYQKMVAFVAPLSTQVIPGQVLRAFRSISQGLAAHIAETFKPQPSHVSAARLAPAQLFCHLLTRMLDANQSANAASAWLHSAENRTQMWEDFKSFVTPIDVISRSHVPMCHAADALDIFRDRLKVLLSPLINQSPEEVHDAGVQNLDFSSAASEGYTDFPDRWIAFIYQLPLIFAGHDTRCIVEKVDTVCTTLLHQLTLGGCQSFSAWWMTKVFFLEMIHWYSELGGFMQATPKSLRLMGSDSWVDVNDVPTTSAGFNSSANVADQTTIVNTANSKPTTTPGVQKDLPHLNGTNSNNATGRGATSRDTDIVMNNSPSNDDSAIGLDDDSMLLPSGKYGDMTASDPADAEGDVVVV